MNGNKVTWVGLAALVLLAGFVLYLPTLAGEISYSRTAAQVKALREGMEGLAKGDTLSPLYRRDIAHPVATSLIPSRHRSSRREAI